MPTRGPAEALAKMLTPPQLEDAKQILLAARNKATVIWAVALMFILIDQLILSPTYDTVPNANWKSPPLPAIDGINGKLTMPKPNLTVDYRYTYIKVYKVISELGPLSTPGACGRRGT